MTACSLSGFSSSERHLVDFWEDPEDDAPYLFPETFEAMGCPVADASGPGIHGFTHQNRTPTTTVLPSFSEMFPTSDPFFFGSWFGPDPFCAPGLLQQPTLTPSSFHSGDRLYSSSHSRSSSGDQSHSTSRRECGTAVTNACLESSGNMPNLGTTSTNTDSYECKICNLVFRGEYGKGNLKRHKRTSHQDANEFSCSHCSRTYRRRDALLKHTRKYHPEVPFRRQLPGTNG
jgi:rubredoxin